MPLRHYAIAAAMPLMSVAAYAAYASAYAIYDAAATQPALFTLRFDFRSLRYGCYAMAPLLAALILAYAAPPPPMPPRRR